MFAAAPREYAEEYDDPDGVSLTETASARGSQLWRLSEGSKSEKKILPDVRSDIYCLALTLYYLLTGRNPRIRSDREPKTIEDFAIEPIPADKVSAPFAEILEKAMQPDPEQRFRSAAEMLEAVNMLHYNDPRSRRLRRAGKAVSAACCAVFALGMFTAYVGMKRGDAEKTSAAHADEAITLLRNGDRAGALKEALAGLPERNVLFAPEYLAKPQPALSMASRVYDLRGGFTDTMRVKLPAVSSFVRLSPDGKTGAAVCGDKLILYINNYQSYSDSAEIAVKISGIKFKPITGKKLKDARGKLSFTSNGKKYLKPYTRYTVNVTASENGTSLSSEIKLTTAKNAFYSVKSGTTYYSLSNGSMSRQGTLSSMVCRGVLCDRNGMSVSGLGVKDTKAEYVKLMMPVKAGKNENNEQLYTYKNVYVKLSDASRKSVDSIGSSVANYAVKLSNIPNQKYVLCGETFSNSAMRSDCSGLTKECYLKKAATLSISQILRLI